MASEAAHQTDGSTTKPTRTNTLYIWGFDKTLTQDVVREEFSRCADVLVNRVTIIKDKATGISKGFGYVECGTPDDATKAMKEMDGKVIGKNPVRIKYSFSDTPEWLKFLDSKGGLEERPRRGHPDVGRRGRGRGGGGRDYHPEDFGRGPAYGRYEGGRVPCEDYPYERAPPRHLDDYDRIPYDDRYDERRLPVTQTYDRRPIDDPYERRPYNDPYDRRPIGVTSYERRPLDDPLERRPGHDPYYERLPPLEDPYETRPLPRRDVYEDRRDLYRPSDRADIYREPPRARSPEPLRLPPASVDYRGRSPIDRRGADRDPYYSAPVPNEDIHRGPGGNPMAVEYRPTAYSARDSLYDGVPVKRAPLDSLPSRVSDPYADPYARIEPH